MRVPALETVRDHVMPSLAREGLDEKLAGPRQHRAERLHLQPFAHVAGEAMPLLRAGEKAAHAPRQIGRDRPPRAAIGRDARSEEHTSELQSLMRISYAVFCLDKKNNR